MTTRIKETTIREDDIRQQRKQDKKEPERITSETYVLYAYGNCGHRVKPEHAGMSCGACIW